MNDFFSVSILCGMGCTYTKKWSIVYLECIFNWWFLAEGWVLTLAASTFNLWPWEPFGTGILHKSVYQKIRKFPVNQVCLLFHWMFCTLSSSSHFTVCGTLINVSLSCTANEVTYNHSITILKVSINVIYISISSQLLTFWKTGFFWLKNIWWSLNV